MLENWRGETREWMNSPVTVVILDKATRSSSNLVYKREPAPVKYDLEINDAPIERKEK
jgi:hypothetical protein